MHYNFPIFAVLTAFILVWLVRRVRSCGWYLRDTNAGQPGHSLTTYGGQSLRNLRARGNAYELTPTGP
jgi:hypothetical protein